jgi:hypothetical protein
MKVALIDDGWWELCSPYCASQSSIMYGKDPTKSLCKTPPSHKFIYKPMYVVYTYMYIYIYYYLYIYVT